MYQPFAPPRCHSSSRMLAGWSPSAKKRQPAASSRLLILMRAVASFIPSSYYTFGILMDIPETMTDAQHAGPPFSFWQVWCGNAQVT